MGLLDRGDRFIAIPTSNRRSLPYFCLMFLLLIGSGCVEQSKVQKNTMKYSSIPSLEDIVDEKQPPSRPEALAFQEMLKPIDGQALSKQTPTAAPRILISKTKRQLEFYRGDELMQAYNIGLGFSPYGDKFQAGDGRTPEGKYTVVVKNPKSKFYLSLGLNYPNHNDATDALMDGRITLKQFNAINAALSNGEPPPWNTSLGGEIFIHGHGAYRDWTKGCIALEDADVQKLYAMVEVGTEVVIQP